MVESSFFSRRADCALGYSLTPERASKFMVDDTGIEPVTPSMSTKCSTAELIIHVRHDKPAPYNETGRGRTASGPGAIKGVGIGIKGFWHFNYLRYDQRVRIDDEYVAAQ